ncbi:MAG: YXWGXW repeat-containing protein [Pseudomonadota bacterium]
MRLPALLLASVLCMAVAGCVSPPPRRHALVEVSVRPPAPRVIVAPGARRGFVWAPGYWRWNGRAHVWTDGRWLRERRGEHWVAAHWEESRRGYWHFEQGHWER